MGTQLELFYKWIEAIQQEDMTSYWLYPLFVVLFVGLLIATFTFIYLMIDANSINHANKHYAINHSPKSVLDDLSGCVLEWAQAIIGRSNQGHASGVNELDILFANRYSKGAQWIDWLRNMSTTIGLVFTFIGLGMALQQLSEALQTNNSGDVNLLDILSKIQKVLPAMGTAFASSIAGICVSMLLGLIESFLSTWRVQIEDQLAKLSIMWLEPGLLPMNDSSLMSRVAEAINSTREIMDQSSKSAIKLYTGIDELIKNVRNIPDENKKLWHFVVEDIKKWNFNLLEEHRVIVGELNEHWTKAVGDLAKNLDDATLTSTTYSETISNASQVLQKTLFELKSFSTQMTSDLTLSAKHIVQLKEASEAFTAAQIESVAIIQDSRFTQESMMKKVEKTFELIPIMTQTITVASSSTASAADRLASVIDNSNMQKYVEQISDLAHLANEEKESRLKMHEVVLSLAGLSDNLNLLQNYVLDIGRTATALQQSYGEMVNQISTLSENKMLPVMKAMLRESVQVFVDDIFKKQTDSLDHQTHTLSKIDATLEHYHKSLSKIADNRSRTMNSSYSTQNAFAEPSAYRPSQSDISSKIADDYPELKPKSPFPFIILIILVMLGGIGYWQYEGYQSRKRKAAAEKIEKEKELAAQQAAAEKAEKLRKAKEAYEASLPKPGDTHLFSKIEFQWIPGGDFELASHQIKAKLEPYYLSKTEITVAQYQECVDAKKCDPMSKLATCTSTMPKASNQKLPITCVTWENAKKYAHFMNGDLPTEAEWLFAASNGGKKTEQILPADCSALSFKACKLIAPTEVCAKKPIESNYGLCDMFGNVSEILRDPSLNAKNESEYVLKGGSFMDKEELLNLSFKKAMKPMKLAPHVGFRVKLPYSQPQLPVEIK